MVGDSEAGMKLEITIDGSEEVDIVSDEGKTLATVYPPYAYRRAKRILIALEEWKKRNKEAVTGENSWLLKN